jgi:hypothetical protein
LNWVCARRIGQKWHRKQHVIMKLLLKISRWCCIISFHLGSSFPTFPHCRHYDVFMIFYILLYIGWCM